MNTALIIKDTPLLKGFGQDVIDELAASCIKKKYTKKQYLFEAGDKADSLFVIASGWVKLSRVSRNGDEVIINIFGPGETFAEAAVFGQLGKYPANAQAVSDVELIRIPKSCFVKKIEEDSQFALQILASISAHQHYLVGQLEQVTTRTAPQRIGAFLLRFCEKADNKDGNIVVILPYDKFLISNRLNIKPETFSRALSKLKSYGIKLEGNDITIDNLEKLESFCDMPISGRRC